MTGEMDVGEGQMEVRRDYVHMGTWVAGDITDVSELSSTSIQAQYQGTSLANVMRDGNQYIAAGGFTLDIDLANRSGALAITDLDGASYGAAVSDPGLATSQALFSGNLVGTNGYQGEALGALVNSPTAIAAGAIGQFHAVGTGNNRVVGTFMGRDITLNGIDGISTLGQ